RGDAEDGEDRGLYRVPGRGPFASQDVEPDPAPRARDRVAHAVPAGRVTPHREARIAFRSQSMVSRSAWVPIVPIRIVFPRSGPSPPEMYMLWSSRSRRTRRFGSVFAGGVKHATVFDKRFAGPSGVKPSPTSPALSCAATFVWRAIRASRPSSFRRLRARWNA